MWPLCLKLKVNEDLDENTKSSIFKWKASQRLSLSDIIISGDATAMLHWRILLNVCYDHFSVNSNFFHEPHVSEKFAGVEKLHKLWIKWYCKMDYAFAARLPKSKSIQLWLVLFLIGRYYRKFESFIFGNLPNFGLSEDVKIIVSYVLNVPDDINFVSVFDVLPFTSCWNYLMEVIEVSKSSTDLTMLTFTFLRNVLQTFGKTLVDDTMRILLNYGLHLNAEEQPRLLFSIYSLMADTKIHINPKEENVQQHLFNQLKLLPSSLHHGDNKSAKKLNYLKDSYNYLFTENSSILKSILQSRDAFEICIQQLIQIHVRYSLHSAFLTKFPLLMFGSFLAEFRKPNLYNVSVCRSSVRIDIAGGWSDTPPICYDQNGAVSV
jgi:hypothetical protein